MPALARLWTREAAREKTFAWSSTEPRGSGTRATLVRRRKDIARYTVAAPGNDEARVLEWECFGVQKSIGRTAGRDARGRYQAHHGHARPSSKESQGLGKCLRRVRTKTVRGLASAPSNHGDAGRIQAARASLVGIASGGVRARGLGKSKGRERATADTMEGCPSRGRVPLNPGRGLGLWPRG